MLLFRNMKISTRLVIAFALLLAVSSISSLLAIRSLGAFSDKVRVALDECVVQEQLATEWANGVHINGVRTIAILKDTGDSMETMLKPDLEAVTKRVSEIQEKLEKAMQTPEEKALLDEVVKKRKEYSASRNQVFRLKSEHQVAELSKTVDESVVPAMRAYIESINKLAGLFRGYSEVIPRLFRGYSEVIPRLFRGHNTY